MEASQESVIVRINRLNEQFINSISPEHFDDEVQITMETLLDAILLLYDECNTDHLKSLNPNIANFVNLYHQVVFNLKRCRVNISDFEVKAIIGRGHFGDVHVVKEKQTGLIYAMKTIRKTGNVSEEKNIMSMSQSQWITVLQYSFQDCNNLYFVMEYHPGGDLLGLIYRQGGTIPEAAATFYIAELILALNDLHKLGFVHRDIKPENILLDCCGHVKLADFGSAAKLDNEGMVILGLPIGTPDYIAPEVLQCMENKVGKNKPTYGVACDYWSLGILAYELVVGNTPFSGQNTTATYSKIIGYANNLKFPAEIALTQGYTQLLHQLIHTNANMRLNYYTIMKQTIFQHIDFNSIRDQVPPYVPQIKSLDDTNNFSDIQIKANKTNLNIENFKRKTQFSGKHLPYLGFTYVNKMTQPTQMQGVAPLKMIKNELMENLKKEITSLKKRQSKTTIALHDLDKNKASLERNLEEKSRKFENMETLRDRLERDLAIAISESTALKRTLELERKDRSELELKALDIIRCTKSKWDISEKLKIDALHTEILNLKEWVEQLRSDNAILNQELKKNHQEKKRKTSIEKVERLRRNSVIGLESRLDKVTIDSQIKISSAQSELYKISNEKTELINNIAQLKKTEIDLRNEMINIKKGFDTYRIRNEISMKTLSEYKNTVSCLRAINVNLESAVDDLSQQIITSNSDKSGIEMVVRDDVEKIIQMETILTQLKEELAGTQTIYDEYEHQLRLRYESEMEALQSKLCHFTIEQECLHTELRATKENDENNTKKMQNLEELLSSLSSVVSRLRTGSNAEQVLQERVKQLEDNIMQVHENLALEKHECMQMKSKFWRLEKKLSNAELDRKIVERDLKDSKTTNNELNQKIDALQHQIGDIIMLKDSNFAKAVSNKKKHEQEVENLRKSLTASSDELRVERSANQELKMRTDILRQDVQSKDFSIASLRTELDDAQSSVMALETKLLVMHKENDLNSEKLLKYQRDQSKYENEIMKLSQEIDDHVLNRGALREACTMLEEQLLEFERIYNISESKRTILSEQLTETQGMCALFQTDLQQARQCNNEQKSLRLFAETRTKRVEEDFAFQQKEHDVQLRDAVESKSVISELSEELKILKAELKKSECTVREFERQLESVVSECNSLKEENSQQRTAISKMKDSNYRLGNDFVEIETNSISQSNRIKELEILMGEKESYYEERDLKAQSTIQQQSKLVDFLQSKINESKKKKTLSDKLFGHSRKENIPTTANVRDLETKLAKQREQMQKLRTEIAHLRFKLHSHNSLPSGSQAPLHTNDDIKVLEQSIHDEEHHDAGQNVQHNTALKSELKICAEQRKCTHCDRPNQLGRRCSYCSISTVYPHSARPTTISRTCGVTKAYNEPNKGLLHYNQDQINYEIENLRKVDCKMEGWIKMPILGIWEKRYGYLTANYLNIYSAPPNQIVSEPIQTLPLYAPYNFAKVIVEPVESEIGVPVEDTEVPFLLKVNVRSSSCCAPESLVFMTFSLEDKQMWYKALEDIFNNSHSTDVDEDIIYKRPSTMEINLIFELASTAQIMNRLLCTMSGLYVIHDEATGPPLHIAGPLQVHDVSILPLSDIVLMVVDDNHMLIQCDLHHLTTLVDCAPFTAPTLKFNSIPVLSNNDLLAGFRMVTSASTNALNGHQEVACAATDKRIVIMAVEMGTRQLQPIRILNSAEPTSCMLFTEFALLIGADKFFEVALRTFEVKEFLEHSYYNLESSLLSSKLPSFPIAIVEILPNAEYLIAFKEFGLFVDKFGCNISKKEIIWRHLPRHIHYVSPYLYVIHISAVEISKLTSQACNPYELKCMARLDLDTVKFLGAGPNGIYVECGKNIRYICASNFEDYLSSRGELQQYPNAKEVLNISEDMFSFTSSMVRSLDGSFGDNNSQINEDKRVQFANEADL